MKTRMHALAQTIYCNHSNVTWPFLLPYTNN